MAIDPIDTKLIDTLLTGYKKPEDIIGKNGLLKQHRYQNSVKPVPETAPLS